MKASRLQLSTYTHISCTELTHPILVDHLQMIVTGRDGRKEKMQSFNNKHTVHSNSLHNTATTHNSMYIHNGMHTHTRMLYSHHQEAPTYVHLIPVVVTNGVNESLVFGLCQLQSAELLLGHCICRSNSTTVRDTNLLLSKWVYIMYIYSM